MLGHCLQVLAEAWGSWLSGLPFWDPYTGLRQLQTWEWEAYLLLTFSFCMSFGLVRDWFWKRPSPGIGCLDARFQCRLFSSVQALIFGASAGPLGHFIGLCVICLAVLAGSYLAMSLPIIAGCGTLGGRSVVVVSPLGLESPPRRV